MKGNSKTDPVLIALDVINKRNASIALRGADLLADKSRTLLVASGMAVVGVLAYTAVTSLGGSNTAVSSAIVEKIGSYGLMGVAIGLGGSIGSMLIERAQEIKEGLESLSEGKKFSDTGLSYRRVFSGGTDIQEELAKASDEDVRKISHNTQYRIVDQNETHLKISADNELIKRRSLSEMSGKLKSFSSGESQSSAVSSEDMSPGN